MGATSNFNYGIESTYDNPTVDTPPPRIKEKVCPNCHYCPTCGRGPHYPNYVPYYPYLPTNEPIYPHNQTWI